MKRTLIISSICIGLIYLFSANNSGVGFAGSKDRTGGPFSGTLTCSQCHNSSAMALPATTVEVLDAGNNPVTFYIPDENYTVRFSVFSTTASSYGFQAVALKNIDNTQAGSFTPQGPNTRVTNLGPRQYPEQSSRSASGVFTYNWLAPVEGSGDVKFYVCGNAVNNSNSAAGDKASTTVFTLSEQTFSNVTEVELSKLILFPNPSENYLSISGLKEIITQVSIFDLSGKHIVDFDQSMIIDATINISDLSQGTFIIRILSNTNYYSSVFIKK